MSDIEMIKRGFADDHRGSVEFYNDLDLSAYKRFYIVNGSFLVGVVEIDNWESPDKSLKLESFEMNAESDILFIPSGYANGAMSLSDDSTVMYFSTSNLEESLDDDFRFDSKYWDIWTEKGGVLFE